MWEAEWHAPVRAGQAGGPSTGPVDRTKVRSGQATAGCRCQAEECGLKLGFCSNSQLNLMEKCTSVNVHVVLFYIF